MRLDLSDLRYTGMTLDEIEEKDGLTEPGDLLFTRYNGNINLVGACARVPDNTPTISYPDKLIRVKLSTEISSRFVCYAWAWSEINKKLRQHIKTTAGQAGISGSSLKSIKIPIAPLAEQHRIVESLEEHLSRLDAGISSLKLVEEKVQRFISTLYGRAASGYFSRPIRDDEAVNESSVQEATRSQASRRWKPSPSFRIPGYTAPKNWSIISLGDLCHSFGYGTSTKCDYGAPGYPVLRIPNIQSGSIDLSDIKNAVDSTLDLTRFSLAPRDLLFVRTNGSKNLIGRVGVVEDELPYAFASYLIRFCLTQGFVEPRWVQMVTQSPPWRKAIENYSASSAGQYNLSSEILSRIPVPIPPLDVQRKTLDIVDAMVTGAIRLSKTGDIALARSERLRSALLQRAFSGELVPQDPADEPASALLDRIRTERAAQGARSGKGGGRRAGRRPRGAVATVDGPSGFVATASVPADAVQQELAL